MEGSLLHEPEAEHHEVSLDAVSVDAPAVPQTRWVGARRAIPAIGLAGVCAAAAFTELSADEGTIYCPYRILTGGWCPGCGCTRALKALVRGNVTESLAMNPVTSLLFVQAVVASVFLLVMPARTVAWVNKNRLSLSVFNLVAILSIWVVRLATGTIPLPFT